MKINRSLSSALAQPWAIRASSMAVMMDSIVSVNAADMDAAMEDREDAEPYEIDDGIAVIRVHGVIGKKIPQIIADIFGMTDVDSIGDLVKAANADAEVRSILLDVDSPGGTVTGVPEVAQIIRDSEKMVVAYSDNLMASAAYWLASGAAGVFGSESALVGSIGVFIPVADMTEMYRMAGIEMDIIKAGDLKAANFPGTSLSREQRSDFQQGVDYVFAKFTGFVKDRQGVNPVPDSAMRGQDFYGDQALEVGLLDGVDSRASVMDALRKLATK